MIGLPKSAEYENNNMPLNTTQTTSTPVCHLSPLTTTSLTSTSIVGDRR
jgi:hypothetical protein